MNRIGHSLGHFELSTYPWRLGVLYCLTGQDAATLAVEESKKLAKREGLRVSECNVS